MVDKVLTTGSLILVVDSDYLGDGSGAGVPGQMTPPTLAAGSTQIIVTRPVAAPPLNGGSALQYDIRYSTDESNWTEVLAAPDNYAILSLTNGVNYAVQIRVVTEGGAGGWSVSSVAMPNTPFTVPGQMQKPTLTPGDTTLLVNLAEGTATGGSAITREDGRHSPDGTGSWTELTGVADPFTITGLTNNVDRYVQTRAVNAQGVGPWSASEIGRPFASTSPTEPAADTTVSTLAALEGVLNSWKGSAWNTTIPAGKTAQSERYIDCNSGSYGGINWASSKNYKFPAKVHIRSVNKVANTAKFSRIYITGASNISFEYITVQFGTWNPGSYVQICTYDSCDNVDLKYSCVYGDAAREPTLDQMVAIGLKKCTYSTVRECFVKWSSNAYIIEGGSNNLFIDNMADDMRGDDIKFSGSNYSECVNHWFTLTKYKTVASDHVDYWQEQTNTGNQFANPPWKDVIGVKVTGCLMYKRNMINKSFQGIFLNGRGTRSDFLISNNILAVNNSDIKQKTATSGDEWWTTNGGNQVLNNNCLRPDDRPCSSNFDVDGTCDNLLGVADYNICALYTSKNAVTAGPGANGIKIDIGNTPTNPNNNNVNYAAQHTYFVGPITGDDTRTATCPIQELCPKTGTRAHWSHAQKTGAWSRSEDIFVNGLHPGNSKNQILAQEWQNRWNFNGFVTT